MYINQAGRSFSSVGELSSHLREQAAQRQPISSRDLELLGLTAETSPTGKAAQWLSGYVREGDLYVFKSQSFEESPAQQSGETKGPNEKVQGQEAI